MPERERTADKRVAIVLPQTSLRETVHQILRNVAGLKMSMVLGPTDVANASREVGCIHTVQGYDLNYVGVIIGPEINPQGGRLRLSAYLSACIPVHDPGKSGRFSVRSADIAGVVENVVYLELVRRGWRVSVGVAGDREIDFVAQKGESLRYYQVCAALDAESTIEREFGSLESVDDQWPKAVISLAPAPITGRNGIPVIALRDFLLGSAER